MCSPAEALELCRPELALVTCFQSGWRVVAGGSLLQQKPPCRLLVLPVLCTTDSNFSATVFEAVEKLYLPTTTSNFHFRSALIRKLCSAVPSA